MSQKGKTRAGAAAAANVEDAAGSLTPAEAVVSPHTSQQDPPATAAAGTSDDVLQLYTEAVWQRLQTYVSKSKGSMSLRVGLFKNMLPESFAEAPPALIDVPTTADVAALKLLVEKYTQGALQPFRVFVVRGTGGKKHTEISEGRTLVSQGIEEGDTIWIDSRATDSVRSAVWAYGPLTAPHLFKSAAVAGAATEQPVLGLASASKGAAIKGSAAAGGEPAAPPSASVSLLADGTRAAGPKVSHKKKKEVDRAAGGSATEAAAGQNGSPTPLTSPAKAAVAAGAAAATARKAGQSTAAADLGAVASLSSPGGHPDPVIRAAKAATAAAKAAVKAAGSKAAARKRLSTGQAADDTEAAGASVKVTGIAALAAAAGIVAALGGTSSGGDGGSEPVPPASGRRLKTRAGAPAPAPDSDGGAAGPSVKRTRRASAAVAEQGGARAGEGGAEESESLDEEQEEGGGRRSSRRRTKSVRATGSSDDDVEDAADADDEVDEDEADLLLDVAAGFKRKRQRRWDTETTLALLKGITRFYLRSSPDVVTEPWVRIRMSYGNLPGKESRSALKDRFINICNAAKRNFVGCRDKSLLSPEVQALALKINEELGKP